MKTRISPLVSVILLFTSFQTQAEWMLPSESPIAIVNSSDNVTIDKDGLDERIVESEMQVMNEQGRNMLVLQTVPFSPDATTATFIKASSVTEGVESPVNAKDVVIRPAKGPVQGINHMRELVIPFNNLKVGSITKYTVKMKTKKNMVKGLYQGSYGIGFDAPEFAGRGKIKSLLPLYININDPWKVLTTKEGKEGDYYTFEFEQTKPLFKVPKESMVIMRKNHFSRIDVTTMNDWNKFVTPLAEQYEKILAVKVLPPSFTTIINKAKKVPAVTHKIDVVTSELSIMMTYAGNWTSFEKGFIAKPLSEIAKSKTGDCKDFAIATTAMLRKMGIDAKVAMVRRSSIDGTGYKIENQSPQLVNPHIFNHAIVKVNDGGKILWVDPTNIVSNSAYIFPDIAGSDALEISATAKNLEKLPYPSADETKLTFDKTIKINEDGSSDAITKFEATGLYAKSIAEAAFTKNEEEAKKVTMSYLRSDIKNAKALYENINFYSRIANKFSATQKTVGEELVKWEDKKLYINTMFPISLVGALTLYGHRVTDANAVTRYKESSTTHITGYDFVGEPGTCTVLTPWYSLTREYFREEKGFRIVDEASFNEIEIPAKEINSDKFQYFLPDIQECMGDRYVEIKVLDPAQTLASRTKEENNKKALEQLNIAGPRSVEGARHAFRITGQILQANPDDKDAQIIRARAYRRIGYKNNVIDNMEYIEASANILKKLEEKYPKDPQVLQQKAWIAIKSKKNEGLSNLFSDAYKVSPKDYDLYFLGGNVLERLKQDKAAIGSYTKALEMARTDSEKAETAQELAGLLIHNQEVDKGIAYYKFAIKADPGNAWLAGNFANKMKTLKRWDDAIAIGEDVVRTNPYGMAKNNLANSYAGKANSILEAGANNPLDKVKNMDSAEQLFSKGLTHSPQNENCLKGLAEIYSIRATEDKNPMTAQKSLRYIDKALASKKISEESMYDMKNRMTQIAEGRAPAAAATVPTPTPSVSPVTSPSPSVSPSASPSPTPTK